MSIESVMLPCNHLILCCPLLLLPFSAYVPATNTEEAEVEQFYEDLQDLLELTPKKMSFSSQGTGMQVRSQQIPGITGKFGFAVQNEAGQRLHGFAKRPHWS